MSLGSNTICTSDDRFLDDFVKLEQAAEPKPFEIDFEIIEKDDLLVGKTLYEHILTLPDEITISDYISGLKRLIYNGFHFTISESAKRNLEESRRTSNNIFSFMESKSGFEFAENGQVTTAELYEVYKHWCYENAEVPRGVGGFSRFLKDHQQQYKIHYDGNTIGQQGQRARGYTGIQLTKRYQTVADLSFNRL